MDTDYATCITQRNKTCILSHALNSHVFCCHEFVYSHIYSTVMPCTVICHLHLTVTHSTSVIDNQQYREKKLILQTFKKCGSILFTREQ